MIIELLAAATEAAPENKFGFLEAMQQGGAIAWSILTVLVIMSVGSFYIMITKLLEQRKIMSQYNKTVRNTFWRAANLREGATRSEEHTSELQSLMRISYAVFCLKKKTKTHTQQTQTTNHINYNYEQH